LRKVEPISSFEEVKLLVDSRRMDILPLLMASLAMLAHLSRILNQSPSQIRHYILTPESAGLIGGANGLGIC